MNGRIKKDKIDLDKNIVQNFFSNRVEKKLPHRYNYVIYQDDNPDLALKRDKYEKEIISSYLDIKDNSSVLDIGCGVGRWADELRKLNISSYIGVDFTKEFLDIAQNSLKDDDRFKFVQGSFQDLDKVLKENKCSSIYDYVFINGVCMYINDDEIDACLKSVAGHVNKNGKVYIKEGVAVSDRFTLKNFSSKELGVTYNAIYRSLEECSMLIEKYFPLDEWMIEKKEPTWPADLENRKETLNYFWIIKKGEN